MSKGESPLQARGAEFRSMRPPISRRGLLIGGGLALFATTGCGQPDTGSGPRQSDSANPRRSRLPSARPDQSASQTPNGTPTKTPSEAPSPTEAPPPKNSFEYGKGVSDADKRIIERGVNVGAPWLARRTGIDLGGISVYADPDANRVYDEYLKHTIYPKQMPEWRQAYTKYTAFPGDNKDHAELYIITSSPGWTSASPIIGGPVEQGKIHTIIHEGFHNDQRHLGPPYPLVQIGWLYEGNAHYAAALGLAENGIYDYGRIRKGHVSRAPYTPVLNSLADLSIMTAKGDNYSLAFLAVEFLARGKKDSGMPTLIDFWTELGKRGTSNDEAFAHVFGQPLSQFYTEFNAYRAKGFRV